MSDSHHPVTSFETYRNVILALIFLTVVTVAIAKPVSGFDLGVLNGALAMFVATLKAYLVAAYFMGLRFEDKINKSILIMGVVFLALLFTVCMFDIMTRVPVTSTL